MSKMILKDTEQEIRKKWNFFFAPEHTTTSPSIVILSITGTYIAILEEYGLDDGDLKFYMWRKLTNFPTPLTSSWKLYNQTELGAFEKSPTPLSF
jgi:hypothetical protein